MAKRADAPTGLLAAGSPEPVLAFEQVDPLSLTERVYRQLRERLMRSTLHPHQRLRIRELASALGTSETPVREAIFQLARDGALELKPHAYVRVRRLSVSEYVELRDIRLQLEPLAAERAVSKIDSDALRELAAAHERLISAEEGQDYPTAIRANFDFHFGIYWRSNMPQLIDMLENIWVRTGPLLNHLYPHGHPTYDGRHQHELILDALRCRDSPSLKEAVRQDLLEGGRNFLRHLASLENQEAAR